MFLGFTVEKFARPLMSQKSKINGAPIKILELSIFKASKSHIRQLLTLG